MRKTIYSATIGNDKNTYWYGDKLLRIVSAIAHTIQLALVAFIIYLLVR
jgi:hypothetical protein